MKLIYPITLSILSLATVFGAGPKPEANVATNAGTKAAPALPCPDMWVLSPGHSGRMVVPEDLFLVPPVVVKITAVKDSDVFPLNLVQDGPGYAGSFALPSGKVDVSVRFAPAGDTFVCLVDWKSAAPVEGLGFVADFIFQQQGQQTDKAAVSAPARSQALVSLSGVKYSVSSQAPVEVEWGPVPRSVRAFLPADGSKGVAEIAVSATK